MERQKQSTRETRSLIGHIPAIKLLKYRHGFMSRVQPVNFPAKVIRSSEWRNKLRDIPHIAFIKRWQNVTVAHGTRGDASAVCRQDTLAAKHKSQRMKWKFYTGDPTCICGTVEEATSHMLQCSQPTYPCPLDDLITFNDVGSQCMYYGKRWSDDTTIMMMMNVTFL